MLNNNEMLDFFDSWKDEPKNRGRAGREQTLSDSLVRDLVNTPVKLGVSSCTTGQEIGRGMRKPWFNTDEEMRQHCLETAIPSIPAACGLPHSYLKGSPEKDDTDNNIFITNPTQLTSVTLGADCQLRVMDDSVGWVPVATDDFNAEITALKAELMEMRAELDGLKPKESETPNLFDTSLLLKRPSKEFDDSIVRMEMLKSRHNEPTPFMFKAHCLDSALDTHSYPTADRGKVVADSLGARTWYDTTEKKMYETTAMQAMQERVSSPTDYFSELEQAVRFQAAALATSIDDAIIKDLATLVEKINADDDGKDFDNAMALVQ